MFVPAFFGLLLAALVSGQRIQIHPQTQVVIENSSLDVMCQVDYKIEDCRFIVGGVTYRLKPSQQEGDVVYRGELERGQCGAHLSNIRKEWNGNITCTLPPKTGSIEIQASMNLIVAEPPASVYITGLPDQGQYHANDMINVMCVVPEARPVARAIWLLRGLEDGQDIQILEGIHQPVVEPVPGTDKYTLKVNLTRKLTAEDGGKKLICRAEHEALSQPLEAAKQMIVNYKPYRSDSADSQITIFGLKLGSEGRLNVTVRASPPPTAEWTINGQQLIAPMRNNDGSIIALEPMALGNGYYNLTLILKSVEKADVDRIYYLRVSNDEGAPEFTVRISTMDEPAGVELDTGAVVGIVIAALVLLIAISLLVFAKATDRWCFAAGRERDPAKSSGESTPAGTELLSGQAAVTDTESAAGGRRRETAAGRARQAAVEVRKAASDAWQSLRAAMPKGRDKVQASEQAQDEEKPAEKKEGVVYAELALTETSAREAERPAPPSTEYAEIVYTDQGQKDAKE